MRRNTRKWPTAVVASAAMLLTVLAFVGGGRGALGAGESDYTAPSSYTLESLGRGHHLVWEGVNFEVSGKPSRSERENHSSSTSTSASTRRRYILRDVSGEALPGRLLAIMGPSGSGKSSLLNVLAGRVPAARRNHLQGTVDVGGMPLHDFDTQRYVAYVRQEQSFYPFLTVKETLLITAGLRLDRGVSNLQKEALVRDIMKKLGLTQIADTLVGDLRTPGISGGEKRRLGMGLQLIGLESPSVIFLDEPTSGLDSHQALQVMTAVRDLCAEGHTVLVAIHQPRSSIYALFDDILLLSDGMVMYHGSADKVLPALASLGHRCPVNFNPADFMVDLISPVLNGKGSKSGDWQESEAKEESLNRMADAAKNNWEVVSAARQARKNRRESGKWWWTAGIGGVRDSEEEEEEEEGEIRSREGAEGGDSSYGCWPRGEKTKTPFRRGGSTRAVVPASSSDLAVSEVRHSTRDRRKTRRRRSGWPTQFGLLLKRSWRQAMRDKFAAAARVALGFGLGGVFGSVFWKLSLKESSIQNRISLFVNVAMNTAMFGCIRALQTLAVERGVVALERIDEGYNAGAYLTSKILAELPMDTVFPLIFGTTVYFAAGLNAPVGGCVKLAKFLGTLLVHAHASSAVGLMVGSLSPSMEAANLLGPAVIIVSLMISGVHDNIPPYLEKLKVVSTINWGIQGIVTNEMRGIKFAPDGKRLLLGWKLGTNKEVIPGEDVMQKMGFEGEGLGKPTRRLLQIATGCHLVTLLSLFVGVPKFQPLERVSCPPSSSSRLAEGDDQGLKRK